MNKKETFHAESFRTALQIGVDNLSDNDMEPWVRTRIKTFLERKHTDAELYDFMAEIASIPVGAVTIDGQKLCFGAISSFLREMCNVTPYYERPLEQGQTS